MDGSVLDDAIALADGAATVREAAALLRTKFPSLRVVVVDAFDMRDEQPAAVGSKRQLFLGASDGHCWTVTTDPAAAAGFFLTDR